MAWLVFKILQLNPFYEVNISKNTRYCVSLKSGWTTWTFLVIIIGELNIITNFGDVESHVQTGLTYIPMLTIDLVLVLEAILLGRQSRKDWESNVASEL